MDRRITKVDEERIRCWYPNGRVPRCLAPSLQALPDEWDRAQLGHPTPGSYKGQDTSCIFLCEAVFGLIQPKKGEEGGIRLLATAQKTGECEVFFSSYAHICSLLLLLFPCYFLSGAV